MQNWVMYLFDVNFDMEGNRQFNEVCCACSTLDGSVCVDLSGGTLFENKASRMTNNLCSLFSSHNLFVNSSETFIQSEI